MATAAGTLRQRLAPRLWPAWLVLGGLRAAALLPYRAQLGLGTALGWLLPRLSPRHRRIVEINLGLCFPEMDAAARERLARAHFRALGIGVFEVAMSWWGREGMLRPLVRVQGIEHLDRALEEGRGVILLSAHFTTLEIGGRLLSLIRPFSVTYRRDRHPVFGEAMQRYRERLYEHAIQRNDVRAMIRRLREGRVVWYAPDQDFRGKGAVFAPFFGVPASTNTATARFARLSGAAVVPFFARRLPRARGYELTFLPPLEGFPSGDAERDATAVNAVFERMIRTAPEQYTWVHKRFKHRPPGEPGVYP
ncbi:LpxL/LpxP family Kdo(2)-lipid IV(A) lauroyl/palmitoleoyl acyltransferase [Inmirania thermothiophila]|uniref:Lipid A biosynthesis acyltransferase n=1 Tax=Inmirania thermothiophila TaxID=1750597 RepID=A0A3N1XSI3_9GAMM|nr:LpxL/LpxP family Kdo(2)-lipid IV(A) lauroyl/palmitoleoyl acyltransferase [Inmirania thermothiophila]ROR29613.1 KDO2-lipid IV(A) lauroyltransferase [Inmirania thermothiophila]